MRLPVTSCSDEPVVQVLYVQVEMIAAIAELSMILERRRKGGLEHREEEELHFSCF